MKHRLHLFLLAVFRHLPVWARRRVVRTIAPGFTVGAMCFIEREDGALLLVRLSYRHRWGVPGGLLKRREEAHHAAAREVMEEVGIEITLHGEPAVVVAQDARRVDVVYRARPAPGMDPADARPCSPEIVEARWFPPDALPDLQHETTGALVALARASGRPAATGPPEASRPGPEPTTSGLA